MKRYQCLALLVLIGLAAACQAQKPELEASSPPTSLAVESPAVTVQITETALPTRPMEASGGKTVAEAPSDERQARFPNPIIVFQRQKPQSDQPEEWTVYPTGRVVAGDGSEWMAPLDLVQPLFETIETLEFLETAEEYTPNPACPECVTYTLYVYSQGEVTSVRVVGEEAETPAVLQIALAHALILAGTRP